MVLRQLKPETVFSTQMSSLWLVCGFEQNPNGLEKAFRHRVLLTPCVSLKPLQSLYFVGIFML